MRFWSGQVVKYANDHWIVSERKLEITKGQEKLPERVDLISFSSVFKITDVDIKGVEAVADTVAAFLTEKFKSLLPEIFKDV